MKSSVNKKNNSVSILTVVNEFKKDTQKIYINTLVPEFSYTNNKGKVIFPENCIMQ